MKLFKNCDTIKVRALFLGELMDLKAMDLTNKLYGSLAIIDAGEKGKAILFKYGVAVLFGMSEIEEVIFINQIKQFIKDQFSSPQIEDFELRIDEKEYIENGILFLNEITLEKMQLVAFVLAKSVVLAHYEASLGGIFDAMEPIAMDLKRSNSYKKVNSLVKHIGEILLTQQKMVGRVEIQEKPDLLWDFPELERLYFRLQEEYDLRERHNAIERKLKLIWKTVETMHNLISGKRSYRVEWYIVFLIVFEIILTLVDKIF